ncbi:MAG: DUF4838 domain-containing protein, partial [Victivallaceae bacterium]
MHLIFDNRIKFFGVALICIFYLAPQETTGGGNNKETLEIILAEGCGYYDSKAADELKSYLSRDKNLNIRIKSLKQVQNIHEGSIIIGQAALDSGIISEKELSEVGEQGYVIKCRDKKFYIAGGKYGGILDGVYRFLEEAGFRFYAQDAVIIPVRIEFKKFEDIKAKPFFEHNLKSRLQASPGGVDKKLDSQWPRLSWEHTNQFLVPAAYYGKDHPEYYAKDENGDFYIKKEKYLRNVMPQTMLCISNPEVRKIAKQRLKLWVNAKKEKKFFMVAQMDGLGWCQCEKCKALDTVPGKVMTDRLLDYVNDLAKEIYKTNPDKIITILAYTDRTAPPPRVVKSLAPNVRVFLCVYPPEVKDKGHWFTHKLNRKFLPWYEGWLKKFPGQVYIYDYPYVSFNCLSFIHAHMFERIKRYAKDGIRGLHFNSCPFYMYSLFNYVASKLAWDPSLDTGTLVANFIAG